MSNPPRMDQKVEITKEDEKLLIECYKDAIFYRCFPLVTTFSVINYALLKRGKIRPIQLIALVPAATFGGALLGIASYVPECRRRFADPDLNSDFSRLYSHRISSKDLIEERQQQLHQGTHNDEPESYLKEFRHGEAQITNEDRNKNITYEELRRRNRSQFKTQPSPRSQPHDDDGWNNENTPRPPPSPSKSYLDTKDAKKNKYGDIMD